MDHQETAHKIIIGSAQKMEQLANNSVELVVTSPPYPMIEMWDESMSLQNHKIREAFNNNAPIDAFELMHSELDKVWVEVNRVLIPGGFACINIGDATRTLNDHFALYPNHARIITAFQQLGITNLPNILWRKSTNAPNKFMGSGMLPAGAYATLEHEWILIFRKGGKRLFPTEAEKQKRKESAFFWEERNQWFADLWDLKGTTQKINQAESRKRSAAYPVAIPARLIKMFSLKGDTVLDPFLGTGTTLLAAIANKRNSVGFEIDPSFLKIISDHLEQTPLNFYNDMIQNRIDRHLEFMEKRKAEKKLTQFKHFNRHLKVPVVTSQEKEIKFDFVSNVSIKEHIIEVRYSEVKPVEGYDPPDTKPKAVQLSIQFDEKSNNTN
ncbi:MAG: DNA-methyltransferase [Candidatus Cyclobacteriaceae bacterium M3_2C_046]